MLTPSLKSTRQIVIQSDGHSLFFNLGQKLQTTFSLCAIILEMCAVSHFEMCAVSHFEMCAVSHFEMCAVSHFEMCAVLYNILLLNAGCRAIIIILFVTVSEQPGYYRV